MLANNECGMSEGFSARTLQAVTRMHVSGKPVFSGFLFRHVAQHERGLADGFIPTVDVPGGRSWFPRTIRTSGSGCLVRHCSNASSVDGELPARACRKSPSTVSRRAEVIARASSRRERSSVMVAWGAAIADALLMVVGLPKWVSAINRVLLRSQKTARCGRRTSDSP